MIQTRSRNYKKRGFTLIEILVVIGIIAVLAAVVLIAINPARQFKLARDSQRMSNITAILNAIGQLMAENKGSFMCDGSTMIVPTSSSTISSSGFDIARCLVPNYISAMPFDPSVTGSFYTSTSTYNTNYKISQDTNGRITIAADGEITNPISVTR